MIAANIVHFARVLRRAGMAVGADRVLAALAAVELVGVTRRDDVHAALAAVLLARHEQHTLFDAAFDAFWRDPQFAQQLMQAPGPDANPDASSDVALAADAAPADRLAEALATPPTPPTPRPEGAEAPASRPDLNVTFSERERFQQADFAAMSVAEFALEQTLAEQLPLPVRPVLRRRHERAPNRQSGRRIDLRATLQGMVRAPHTLSPAFTRARRELPAIVVLLDISGSMARYARLLLHYVHGLTRRHLKVHTLVFGTRLTNITRSLQNRDPDVALRAADAQVQDWSGGTRIAACLDEFNRDWARRLLGGNAAVLLMTDGLDRDTHGDLRGAAAQLQRMAHQVVWLNPLLRFDGFEPRAAGVRALLAHVDRFLPVHNLASLADLGRALRAPAQRPAALLHRF